MTMHLLHATALASLFVAPPPEPAPAADSPAAPGAIDLNAPTRPAPEPAPTPAESAPAGTPSTAIDDPFQAAPSPAAPQPLPGAEAQPVQPGEPDQPPQSDPSDPSAPPPAGMGQPAPLPPGAQDPEVQPAPYVPPPPSAAAQRRARVYPDIPIRWRAELYAGGGTEFIHSTGYQAFDDNRSTPAFHLFARADGRLGQTPVFLGGGIGYRQLSSTRSSINQVFDTDLAIREPLGVFRVAVMPVEGFDIYAELQGGPSFVQIEVDESRFAGDATQDQLTGVLGGQAGVLVYLPKKWLPRNGSSRVTAGLDFGLGYMHRFGFDVEPDRELDDDPISTAGTNLGALNLGSLTWRGGLFVRFN